MEMNDCIEMVAEASGQKVEDIRSKKRRRPLPVCRYLIAEYLHGQGRSLAGAGVEMGLNHATVVHGMKMLSQIRDGYGLPEETRIVSRWDELINNQQS
jgi:chromosomal replication initiation ATPase DnaA